MAKVTNPVLMPGVAARRLGVYVLDAVHARHRTLDEAFAEAVDRLHLDKLEARDRAFARMIATTSLRHYGRLAALVDGFLQKPLASDSGRTMSILIAGAAQLVLLDTPPHAAISLSVELTRLDHTARRFDKLVNAVLRRIATEGKLHYATLDQSLDCPPWLWQRWLAAYGEHDARAILAATLTEPPLDLTVKGDPVACAAQLSGVALPTGSVRVREAGRIEDLPGFADGEWWVQDAAAALPARLLRAKPGDRIADLCAAPGGKTAQLAMSGARVLSVDGSAKRMARLEANLKRLDLSADVLVADLLTVCSDPLHAGAFNAVLLDAPCSATGTIRRHPDLMHIKAESEIARLAVRQRELIDAASALVQSGGLLVYATCSLEREEGEGIVDAFLASQPSFSRDPIDLERDSIPRACITPAGDLRTLPHHELGPEPSMAGMDGFYAARLRKA